MPRPPYRKPAAKPRYKAGPRSPLAREYTEQRSLELGAGDELSTVIVKSPIRQSTVFRKRIQDIPVNLRHGDLVRVLLPEGGLLGYGVCNPRAEATLRMLTWGEAQPDAGWWQGQVRRAVQLRSQLGMELISDAYRLIHAEGDGFPGLVADRYGDVISVEAFSLGMYQRAEAVARLLVAETGARHWVLQPGPQSYEQEGFYAETSTSPDAPQRVMITEDELRFEVDFATGHKTGFFCDQRENRRRLQAVCAGKSVLDLCCYSGGFAIHAAAGGAAEVVAVDLDEAAIAMARRNANLNQARVKFIHSDAFIYLRDLQRAGKSYDVVILDPPKLIMGRGQLEEGQRKYYDLNRLASSVVSSGGMLVTCSCSGLLSAEEFTRTVTAAIPYDRSPQLLQRTAAAPDHPVALNTPETEYLKCLWVRLN